MTSHVMHSNRHDCVIPVGMRTNHLSPSNRHPYAIPRLLKRSLYKNELEPKWPGPDDQYDWDIWLRMDENRKGRECIIPDISRTYHFGAKGLNVDNLFQNAYFKRRSLNKETGQRFDIEKMKKDNYEKELQRLIRYSLNCFFYVNCPSQLKIAMDESYNEKESRSA